MKNEEENEEEKSTVSQKKDSGQLKKTVSDHFVNAIESYLKEFALTDANFFEKMKDPNKSILKCCGYICDEVKRMGVKGLCDEEVYQMARHYFNEEDVKANPYSSSNVVINRVIELTEEDKNKSYQNVLKKYEEEQLLKIKKDQEKQEKQQKNKLEKELLKKQKETEKSTVEQLSLFDL